MALQDREGGTGPEAPHPDHLVTAARGQQRVLVVDGHVRDLGRVAPQGGQQAPIVRGPDLHQTII